MRALGFVLIWCLLASSAQAMPFSGAAVFRDLEAQVAFGPRVPGTLAHDRCLTYLEAELRKTTPHVVREPFSVEDEGRTLSMTNLVATFRPGVGHAAMLAAHWDSRPRSEHDEHPEHRALPTPGADDGASGVAVLLEVARALRAAPPDSEVRLVCFDGEDWGTTIDTMFYGARAYVRRHRDSLPAWGVLLDMVGDRTLRIPREGFSSTQAPELTNRVFQTAKRMGYGTYFPDTLGPEIYDDHLPFLDQGVPFVDLIDFDYPYWHTIHDVPDACSPSSLAVVGNLVLAVLHPPR